MGTRLDGKADYFNLTEQAERAALLERVQIGQQVGFVFGSEGVGIRRHTVPAVIDLRQNVSVIHGLTVLQSFMLEKALQGRSHFLFRRIDAVAKGTLFEHCFAFCRIALGRAAFPFLPSRQTGAKSHTKYRTTCNRQNTLNHSRISWPLSRALALLSLHNGRHEHAFSGAK